jgi:type I restriction enzyme S subunit
MSEWKQCRLGDIISIKSGFSYKGEHIGSGDSILLGMGCVSFKEKFLKSGARQYSGVFSEKYEVKPGDLVLATRQQSDNLPILGLPAIIPNEFKNKKVVVGTNLYRVENDSEVSNEFIYWLLRGPNYYKHIVSSAKGTTVRMITKDAVESFSFNCPPKEKRDTIVRILNDLENKIELNNQINQNLEALAQALFKQWFVDFEFPNENGEPYKSSGGEMIDSELGEIPKGWEAHPIGDLFEFVVGGDWGNDFIDEEHTEKCYVIRGTDIPQLRNGSIGNIPIRFIKEKKAISRFLKPGDLVIEISGGSKDQPTGRTILITRELLDRLDNSAIPASFCRLIRPKQGFSEFLGVYFDKIYSEGKTWEYQNQSTGIANFQFKYFEEKEVLALPNDPLIIEAFNELVDPIISTISSNENLDLVKLRDTLLPKLISGELEVSEASLEPTF